jgi:hypothetical protein
LQDALIKEEEEAERLEDQRQASRVAADREKKARKKVGLVSPHHVLVSKRKRKSPPSGLLPEK